MPCLDVSIRGMSRNQRSIDNLGPIKKCASTQVLGVITNTGGLGQSLGSMVNG